MNLKFTEITNPCADDCRDLARRIRVHCLRMTHRGESGHIGSMLSEAEILAVLYTHILRVDPANPRWPQRDRFLLSKGHAGAGVYAVLAERGFFPMDWLDRYYCDDGQLSGHISHHVPGVEFSTGSLGHGLPVAVGMALAARRAGQDHRVFTLLSDGDLNEGSTWEAIMLGAQLKLKNLVGVVDYNRIQSLAASADVLDLEPLDVKLQQFGWAVRDCDGHDVEALEAALKALPYADDKPSMLLARTVKGKGVSFLENTVSCHYWKVDDDSLARGLAELGGTL
jgi:transketolase